MNVVVAMDSFKGSMTSLEAGNTVKKAILNFDKSANVDVYPIADGGEGTVNVFSQSFDGEEKSVEVTGPLGNKIIAKYYVLKDNTAIIEMASAAGINLIHEDIRNPLDATSYGVGEIIKDAIANGCRNFIIGLGGSATNDGGVGMLQALGYKFLDVNGNEIERGAKGLKNLNSISDVEVIQELQECKFDVACDVNNPLCGENGCSAVFGPQKGATLDMIINMDKWLENYAKIVKSNPNIPGGGAAGGLGFAFVSFTNSVLESGIDMILKKINIEEQIKLSDVVITGEGKLDSQSLAGKVPFGVAKLAKKYSKKVIAFVGVAEIDENICKENGIDEVFVINNGKIDNESLNTENAINNLKETVYRAFKK